MFDKFSYDLFNDLPNLPDIDKKQIRREITKAYLYSIKQQLGMNESTQKFDYGIFDNMNEKEIEDFEISEDNDSSNNIEQTLEELRRIGDTLESIAIFDNEIEDKIRKASAFVAAEALSLLATLIENQMLHQVINPLLLSNETIYTRVESSLLYLFSGYDANAFTEVKKIEKYILLNQFDESTLGNLDVVSKSANWLLRNLCNLLSGSLWKVDSENSPDSLPINETGSLKGLINQNLYIMYSNIGKAVCNYILWLTGEKSEGKSKCLSLLSKIQKYSALRQEALFPEIYHLAKIIRIVFEKTSERSTVYTIPYPQEGYDDFKNYITSRSKGNRETTSRPFQWESTKKFVNECLPGPHKNTIVNLPTGSGKSFIAEVAVAQSLSTGWVLYLAPTNALVHQIRGDIKQALITYPNIEVRSFIGNDEYTTLQSENIKIEDITANFVAVMTPEKCALTLRTNPEIFKYCSLCILDECHLLSEKSRGLTVDLVLGQIISINSRIKFVLMSAMLNNPKDIANWLENTTSTESVIADVPWKPTRIVRGAVGIDYDKALEAAETTKEKLNLLPERRKKLGFETPISILFGLSGIWDNQNYNDYHNFEIDTNAKFNIRRKKINESWNYNVENDSWVNQTSRTLGIKLARSNLSTIVFISTNRHYPFTLAKDVNLNRDSITMPVSLLSHIKLAEFELGITSEVGRLIIEEGVAVHTAYMLDNEKEAAELAFKKNLVSLMIATGTLAQGLNLPSVAVVIAGTRIGDAREQYTAEAQQRSKALVLNAIGRAGRAGFSNHSLSLIVPNEPLLFKNESIDISNTLSKLEVLKDRDSSINVISPIGVFLNNISNGIIRSDIANLQELQIVTFLSDQSDKDETTSLILKNTYGAYKLNPTLNNNIIETATKIIYDMKHEFLDQTKAPEWIISAGRKSGFDFFTTQITATVIDRYIVKENFNNWSIKDWTKFLFEIMSVLPPFYIKGVLPENITAKDTFINNMKKKLINENDTNLYWEKPHMWDELWIEFFEVTWMYMTGENLSSIAKRYLNITEVDSLRTAGKPIPDTISFIKKQIDYIGNYAGLIVAILEEIFNGELVYNLEILPLLIKNGCSDNSSIVWFKYGFRNRMIAHLMAKHFPLTENQDEEQNRKQVISIKKKWKTVEIEKSKIPPTELEIIELAFSLET